MLDVLSGGSADPTVISSGGTEVVSTGGTDTGAVISSGGTQVTFGAAGDASILSGGKQSGVRGRRRQRDQHRLGRHRGRSVRRQQPCGNHQRQ